MKNLLIKSIIKKIIRNLTQIHRVKIMSNNSKDFTSKKEIKIINSFHKTPITNSIISNKINIKLITIF